MYISHWKKGVHGVQGGEKALEKAHKREKTREIACTLQSKMVCSKVCIACRRCAAHVGMASLFLGVLLLPPLMRSVVRAVWPATTALRASVAFEKVRMRHAKPYWMVFMLFRVPNMR